MFDYISSLSVITLEVVCYRCFFHAFAEQRERRSLWKNSLTTGVIVIGTYFFAGIFVNSFILKQISILLFSSLCMKVYSGVKWRKSVVLSTLFQSLLLIVDSFVFFLQPYFLSDAKTLEGENYLQSYQVVVLGKVTLFFVIIILRRYWGKDKWLLLDDSQWIKLITVPVFTICSIAGMLKVAEPMPDRDQQNFIFLISCGLTGLNMLLVYLIYDMVKHEAQVYENRIFQMRVDNQTKMYRSISENFNRQKKRVHEYKNQIMCIDALVKQKNYGELKEYVSNISGRLEKELDFIQTNHVIVDAILNSKYQEMIEKNIVFVMRINDLSRLHMTDEDIVVILANLLNNAVEACEKCQQNRVIKLKFVCEDNNIILSVKNTCEHKVIYRDGEIQTTKHQNPEEHGIGIKNIVDTIEKYEGVYVIENDGQEFYFSIMIPMKGTE